MESLPGLGPLHSSQGSSQIWYVLSTSHDIRQKAAILVVVTRGPVLGDTVTAIEL
jgi:hypothetical protein